MGKVSKEALFAPRLPEDDVEIPGVGTVRVRGLSRAEVLKVQRLGKAERDAHMIALGMVDPPMPVTDVQRWAEASPAGEMEAVSRRIGELSGVLEGAQKSGLRDVRDE
ncbi:hypothetical protein V6U90_08045 [Micromonospora sp. CPCC 206060]|uniref:hypothetical protein n=1 Tax=Micromonospora sp. CPCC 206060 TaxID=3122406 RepID=UPI002FF3E60E